MSHHTPFEQGSTEPPIAMYSEGLRNDYPHAIYSTAGRIADPLVEGLAVEAAITVARQYGVPVIGERLDVQEGDTTLSTLVLSATPDAAARENEGSFVKRVTEDTAINLRQNDMLRYLEDPSRQAAGHAGRSAELWLAEHSPEMYYPWVAKEIQPFYQGLRDEVKHNRPVEEMRQLYDAVRFFVENRLPQLSARHDLDIVGEGGIGSLLVELFEHTAESRALHHTQLVWHEGRSLLRRILEQMPASVFQTMRERFADQPELLDCIQVCKVDRARRQDDILAELATYVG